LREDDDVSTTQNADSDNICQCNVVIVEEVLDVDVDYEIVEDVLDIDDIVDGDVHVVVVKHVSDFAVVLLVS